MSIKVLIVDDHVFDAVLTMRAMDDCKHEHKFVSASDGHEAFRLLRAERFDVVLLDIKMPRADGFELLQRLRQEDVQAPPIIVVSTSNLEVDRSRAANLGAIDYVRKELDYQDFKHGLQSALGRHGLC